MPVVGVRPKTKVGEWVVGGERGAGAEQEQGRSLTAEAKKEEKTEEDDDEGEAAAGGSGDHSVAGERPQTAQRREDERTTASNRPRAHGAKTGRPGWTTSLNKPKQIRICVCQDTYPPSLCDPNKTI